MTKYLVINKLNSNFAVNFKNKNYDCKKINH